MKNKKIIISFLISVVLFAAIGCSNANKGKVSEEDLKVFFTGYEGTFVLFDKNKNEYTIYNKEKCEKQVPPCSTFKIIHSLIGLDTRILEDENTTFKWDGTVHSYEPWNKDHSLKTAIQYSTVWYFQNLATQVGKDRMQEYLNKVNYGNKDISGGLTQFWLQSSLKISPIEQIELLKRFYEYKLPFSKIHVDTVKNCLLLTNENGSILYGKTGSGTEPPETKYTNGWFVGYVEKGNDVYFFATNIQKDETTMGAAGGGEAKAITLKILKDKKLL